MSDKKEMIKIHVQNNGGPAMDTKITDANTGRELENVSGLSWIVDLNDPSLRNGKITLTLWEPIIDVIVDAEIKKICPCCGREKEAEV